MFRIGVDLGGTKTSLVVLDDERQVCHAARRATPRGSYPATLELIAAMVAEAEERTGRAGSIGVGAPGSSAPESGRIRNANSVWLNGMPLQRDLEHLLGREVLLANDANCFALSEATDGAARDAAVVFGVILGTGVGGAIVVGGRLIEGANRIGGEWGHNPLPELQAEDGPPSLCYCGRRGCIETYLSGPGFARGYQAAGGGADEADEAAAIFARAAAGEPLAARCLERYIEQLAKALGSVINVLDPDVIVLGGGLSRIATLYEAVPRRWGRYIFCDTVKTRLVQNRHGDDSGVRGAALLSTLLAARS